MIGDAQLELNQDELFDLIYVLYELGDPKYSELYQEIADFI